MNKCGSTLLNRGYVVFGKLIDLTTKGERERELRGSVSVKTYV